MNFPRIFSVRVQGAAAAAAADFGPFLTADVT